MDNNWNVRLKKCREEKGYSLKDLSTFDKLDMSQQSLIKYENGSVFPRINVLEKMCRLYETTIEYILYGNDKLKKYEDRSNSLVTLFFLFLSKKIEFDKLKSTIRITDKGLKRQIGIINEYCENIDICNFQDIFRLINGIKKIVEEE